MADDCELAVVYCLDVSASMSETVNGDTRLDRLKAAASASVGNFPTRDSDGMGLWKLGLVTFPNTGAPLMGLTLVDDGNRGQIASVIEGMQAGGGTELSQALYLAGFMLATYAPERPHAIVVFSDGLFWDANTATTAATGLKNSGVFILTVGGELEPDAENAMKEIASHWADGSPAYIASTYANLAEKMLTGIGLLCPELQVSFEAAPDAFTLAPGGKATGQYQVTHLGGPPREVVLSVVGWPQTVQPIETGPFLLEPGTSGPGDKFQIVVPGNAVSGAILHQTFRATGTGTGLSGGVRASKTVTIKVLGADFTLEWLRAPFVRPRSVADAAAGRPFVIEGGAKVNHELAVTTDFTVSVLARRPGETGTMPGWSLTLSTSSFRLQPGDPAITLDFRFFAPASDLGSYDIEMVLTGNRPGLSEQVHGVVTLEDPQP